MKLRIYLPILCLSACACVAAAESSADKNAVRTLATAPLRFEPASPDQPARFIARGTRFHFEFTPHQAVLRSSDRDIRLTFEGANPAASIQGAELMPSTTNLYLGNDRTKWRRAVANYSRLQVPGLYRGVDLTYYGNGGELEYDLTVQPGADTRRIRLRVDGKNAGVNRHGDLGSDLIQKHPVAYQIGADGARRTVASRYRKNADGSYGFELGAYDPKRTLVIDPVIRVAQYFSGSYQDIAYAVGHDASGRIYVGGTTQSADLPLAGSSYQTTSAGAADVFFAVINPALSISSPTSQVIYVTYFGGSGADTFGGMTVGLGGDVYITGTTLSTNFPNQNAAQATLGGGTSAADAFVVWFDGVQNLKYSTYYGGSEADAGKAITLGSNGWFWITGNTQSTDLPNTGGFQGSLIGTQNMFVAGFDPYLVGGASEVYSIWIGGTHWDEALGIAWADDGSVWIAGGTFSPDIWMAGNAYQGVYGGGGDIYIAHIKPGLGANALLYASFLGGSGIDEATSLKLDLKGRLVLTGYTLSPDFPVTSNAFQTSYGGNTDAFVIILDPSQEPASELVYSSYFGGANADAGLNVMEDDDGLLYVCGYTESAGLPSTADALQTAYDGSIDAFALKLDPRKAGAAGLDYFSYLGSDGIQVAYGIDYDGNGTIYLAGYSSASILSAVGGPDRATTAGNVDGFVIGFSPGSSAPASTNGTASTGQPKHLPERAAPHR